MTVLYLRRTLVLLSLLLGFGRTGWAQPASATVVVPGQTRITNPSAVSRGPDPSQRYQRVVALYPAADVQGIAPGLNLLSLGFRLRTPAATAGSGTLRVWLCNTTHPTYSLANDWAYLLQNPAPFQQVYNGPLTVPAAAGWFDVAFQTPFTYTGDGFYLAYEWETTTPIAASGSYECDDYRTQTLRGGTSASAFPATLTMVSPFRPQLRVGYAAPAQDAALLRVYGPGKTPQQSCVTPYPVQAVVRNAGTATLTNLPVTFTPGTGAGPAVTVTVASLAPGAETTVLLPSLAPTAAPNTYVHYSVRVPTDQNPANDVRADSTLVTLRELTYVTGFPSAFSVGGVGFNTASAASGTLLCRYPLRAPAVVSSIRMQLANYSANAGNTVYAVLLDEQGHLLARSTDAYLNSSQNGQWITFAMPTPVRVTGRAFFAGMAQTRPRVAGQYYYPLGAQYEPQVRDSAYYSAVGDSALLGLKPPRELRTLGRFMVEVTLESAPLATRTAAAPWAPDLWPNPAHYQLHLTLPAAAGPAEATWLDVTGRVVRPAAPLRPAPDGRATLPLAGLPPGLYVLRLNGPGWQRSQRVAVE